MLNKQCVLFQFHKGTIRTLLLAAVLLMYLDFNSIKVRLEPALSCCSIDVP